MVKNSPCNAGDTGSVPGRGTKIPHATGQLSPHAATRETCEPQLLNLQRKPMHCNKEPTWHKTVLKIPMREVLSVYSNGSREKYEETELRDYANTGLIVCW